MDVVLLFTAQVDVTVELLAMLEIRKKLEKLEKNTKVEDREMERRDEEEKGKV